MNLHAPKRTRRALAAFVARGGWLTFVAGDNLTAHSTEPGIEAGVADEGIHIRKPIYLYFMKQLVTADGIVKLPNLGSLRLREI